MALIFYVIERTLACTIFKRCFHPCQTHRRFGICNYDIETRPSGGDASGCVKGGFLRYPNSRS